MSKQTYTSIKDEYWVEYLDYCAGASGNLLGHEITHQPTEDEFWIWYMETKYEANK